jgi:hypothetical protein
MLESRRSICRNKAWHANSWYRFVMGRFELGPFRDGPFCMCTPKHGSYLPFYKTQLNHRYTQTICLGTRMQYSAKRHLLGTFTFYPDYTYCIHTKAMIKLMESVYKPTHITEPCGSHFTYVHYGPAHGYIQYILYRHFITKPWKCKPSRGHNTTTWGSCTSKTGIMKPQFYCK